MSPLDIYLIARMFVFKIGLHLNVHHSIIPTCHWFVAMVLRTQCMLGVLLMSLKDVNAGNLMSFLIASQPIQRYYTCYLKETWTHCNLLQYWSRNEFHLCCDSKCSIGCFTLDTGTQFFLQNWMHSCLSSRALASTWASEKNPPQLNISPEVAHGYLKYTLFRVLSVHRHHDIFPFSISNEDTPFCQPH